MTIFKYLLRDYCAEILVCETGYTRLPTPDTATADGLDRAYLDPQLNPCLQLTTMTRENSHWLMNGSACMSREFVA